MFQHHHLLLLVYAESHESVLYMNKRQCMSVCLYVSMYVCLCVYVSKYVFYLSVWKLICILCIYFSSVIGCCCVC